MLLFLMLLLICLAVGACAVLNQEKFGEHPKGARLERVQSSPNYRDGEFHNTIPTPMLAKGHTSIGLMLSSLFSRPERLRPESPLPVEKHDLAALPLDKDVFVWLGHSSYYMHLGGKRILVDPVFSDHGAPFSFANKIFPGTDLYKPEDMPEIDYLLISHDHWDHLDHPTVTALLARVKTAVMPLGVGAHFERWGYPQEKILEADWNEALRFDNGFTVHLVPARHFSGRTLTRNKTLWGGFVLETPERRIFLSGDSGYGPHIGEIAKAFGKFDLAAVDGGQYDPRWPHVHMTPEEAVKAADELHADTFLLAHVGRFAIAAHPWDEPFTRAAAAAENKNFTLLTPMIGEPVRFDDTEQTFGNWWEGIK